MAEEEALTQWLRAARLGDAEAAGRLYGEVYQSLHAIAHRQLRGQRGDSGPATTSLVHEAYLRLVRPNGADFQDRSHFFAVAARAMRQILIDHLRARQADKRGGGAVAITLDALQVPEAGRSEELLAVDAALGELEALDSRLAQVVELRFFAGLTLEEIGASMGLSERTMKRDWREARAFLHARLKELGIGDGA